MGKQTGITLLKPVGDGIFEDINGGKEPLYMLTKDNGRVAYLHQSGYGSLPENRVQIVHNPIITPKTKGAMKMNSAIKIALGAFAAWMISLIIAHYVGTQITLRTAVMILFANITIIGLVSTKSYYAGAASAAMLAANKNGIGNVIRVSATCWHFISVFIIRTLNGAAVTLCYFFVTAEPETTVYQLSQVTRTDNFWLIAVCLAACYTAWRSTILYSASAGKLN